MKKRRVVGEFELFSAASETEDEWIVMYMLSETEGMVQVPKDQVRNAID